MRFPNHQTLLAYLNTIPTFQKQGVLAYRPGIKAVLNFCIEIGSPHKKFKSIHVAGTNGKGTVCSILSALFIQEGYKTGSFTSPHLLVLNERVKLNGINCSDSDLLLFFNTYFDLIQKYELTYFEQLTVFSFWLFAKQNVDIAIIETGLGGRLDATNIIEPLCSIITSIGLDHQAILGHTIEKIAIEKAGIIKPSTPVFLGVLPIEATTIIREISDKKNAKITELDTNSFISVDSDSFFFKNNPNEIYFCEFKGSINHKNAVICLNILKQLETVLPVSLPNCLIALKQAMNISGLLGRFEQLIPNNSWYFDGAHNPEAIFWLLEHVNSKWNMDEVVIICAFMADKNLDDMITLLKNCKKIYFFTINSPRAATFNQISSYFSNVVLIDETHIPTLFKSLRNDKVIFTGSFYFYTIVKGWISRY